MKEQSADEQRFNRVIHELMRAQQARDWSIVDKLVSEYSMAYGRDKETT